MVAQAAPRGPTKGASVGIGRGVAGVFDGFGGLRWETNRRRAGRSGSRVVEWDVIDRLFDAEKRTSLRLAREEKKVLVCLCGEGGRAEQAGR